MCPPPPCPPADDSVLGHARDWVLRLASGTLDEQGMQQFERWLEMPGHRRAFEHERLLWRSLGARPQTSVVAIPAQRATRRRLIVVAAVAALGCLLFGPQLLLRAQADHRAAAGIARVVLPDGSKAVLDAGSAIAVYYSGHARRVELLSGRAWFEVVPQRDAPFRVTVGDGVVEDISTAFVVGRDGAGVDTAVEQGRVRVAARADQGWMYLDAGQTAGWQADGIAVRGQTLPLDHVAAWRRGELLPEDQPVTKVLEELDRYRPGRIFIRGDLSALPRINGALRLEQPEQALDAVAAGSGLKVTRLPLGIAIVQAASTRTAPRH